MMNRLTVACFTIACASLTVITAAEDHQRTDDDDSQSDSRSKEKETPNKNNCVLADGSKGCGVGGKCAQPEGFSNAICICNADYGGFRCQMPIRNRIQIGDHIKPRMDTRLVMPNGDLSATTFGRYFVKDENECLSLCYDAGHRRCQSVNYGKLQEGNLCELLVVNPYIQNEKFPEYSLEKYVEEGKHPGWQFICCLSIF